MYHQLRNQPSTVRAWRQVEDKIVEFDNVYYNPWNQRWAEIHRGNQEQQLIEYFAEGEKFYDDMDDFTLSVAIPRHDSVETESLKQEVIKNIENDFLSLKASISSQIETGINNVIGLKAEIGLQKNFKENIEAELKNSDRNKLVFLGLFVIAVFAIPSFFLSTVKLDIFKDLKDLDLIFLRSGVTVTLTVLSYFFFSQYRLQQLISLRYSHLYGFLGGGATYIGQIAGNDEDIKKEINKKLAYLFMELDDVFGLVKKNGHPAEKSLEKVGEIIASAINKNG